jgi:hypothetical protein
MDIIPYKTYTKGEAYAYLIVLITLFCFTGCQHKNYVPKSLWNLNKLFLGQQIALWNFSEKPLPVEDKRETARRRAAKWVALKLAIMGRNLIYKNWPCLIVIFQEKIFVIKGDSICYSTAFSKERFDKIGLQETLESLPNDSSNGILISCDIGTDSNMILGVLDIIHNSKITSNYVLFDRIRFDWNFHVPNEKLTSSEEIQTAHDSVKFTALTEQIDRLDEDYFDLLKIEAKSGIDFGRNKVVLIEKDVPSNLLKEVGRSVGHSFSPILIIPDDKIICRWPPSNKNQLFKTVIESAVKISKDKVTLTPQISFPKRTLTIPFNHGIPDYAEISKTVKLMGPSIRSTNSNNSVWSVSIDLDSIDVTKFLKIFNTIRNASDEFSPGFDFAETSAVSNK